MTEQKKTVVLFAGDSITDGGRMKDKKHAWDLNHQIGHCYNYVISALLGSQFPEKNYEFVSRGISGDRVIDMYARNEVDLYPVAPDVLSVMVGVNDGCSGNGNNQPTPQDKYAKIYRMFLEEVKERFPECKIVIMEPFLRESSKTKDVYPLWRKAIEGYAKTAKKLAEEFDAVFVPLQELFDRYCDTSATEQWLWDGVHPTVAGHGLIAVEWLKATKGIVWEEK